jgi:hypothetical protein
MRKDSYNMERRYNETWKKYDVERMESKRKSIEKLGHSQKWMKKTEQLDMNEGIKNEASLIFSEEYIGSCGNNRVRM